MFVIFISVCSNKCIDYLIVVFWDSVEDVVFIFCGFILEFLVFIIGVIIEFEFVLIVVVEDVFVEIFEGLLFEDLEDGLIGVDFGVRGDRWNLRFVFRLVEFCIFCFIIFWRILFIVVILFCF